jgi:hypothetical protein
MKRFSAEKSMYINNLQSEVRDLLDRKQALLAGSYAMTAYQSHYGVAPGSQPGDIDLFTTFENSGYVVKMLTEQGWYLQRQSSIATTLEKFGELPLQVIPVEGLKLDMPIDALLRTFDFDVSQVGYDAEAKQFVMTTEAMIGLYNGKVSLAAVTYPQITAQRLLKYAVKGFDVKEALNQLLYMIASNVVQLGGKEYELKVSYVEPLESVDDDDDLILPTLTPKQRIKFDQIGIVNRRSGYNLTVNY